MQLRICFFPRNPIMLINPTLSALLSIQSSMLGGSRERKKIASATQVQTTRHIEEKVRGYRWISYLIGGEVIDEKWDFTLVAVTQCWVILTVLRFEPECFSDISAPQQVQSTLIWRESGYSHSRRFRPRFHISCSFGRNLQANIPSFLYFQWCWKNESWQVDIQKALLWIIW